jgi:hypothetical protein
LANQVAAAAQARAATGTKITLEEYEAEQNLHNQVMEGFRAAENRENRAMESAERKRARKSFIRFLIRRSAILLHNLEEITAKIADLDLLGIDRARARRDAAALAAAIAYATEHTRNEAWADYQTALRGEDTQENIAELRREFIYCFDTAEEGEAEIVRRNQQPILSAANAFGRIQLGGGNIRRKKQSKKYTNPKKSKKTKRRIRKNKD